MSFVHYTIVGHFDPEKIFPNRPLCALRPLDDGMIRAALNDLPREVQESIGFEEGYMVVQWSSLRFENSEKACNFAYRVAAQERCIAVESMGYRVTFPLSAQE